MKIRYFPKQFSEKNSRDCFILQVSLMVDLIGDSWMLFAYLFLLWTRCYMFFVEICDENLASHKYVV